jgi:hypothetical protein
MRKRYVVVLPEAERALLHTLIGQGAASARALTHARILLKANQGQAGSGWTDQAIADALEVHPTTVARVRQLYVTAGLGAAVYHKHPERQYHRTLDGEQQAAWSRWPVAPRRRDARGGRCGCWPTAWSSCRWWRRSRTRRCGRP